MTRTKPRLTRTDWTDAALGAMARQGTTGVNVEQLARDLGTTKGSFYHHFDDRSALLTAALDRFIEVIETDLAAATSLVAEPRERLVAGSVAAVGSAIDGFVDLALAASADDPTVARALREITELRLSWITSNLSAMGMTEVTARARAEAGLATYLGLFHLQRVRGRRLNDDDLRAHIVRAVDVMCAGA